MIPADQMVGYSLHLNLYNCDGGVLKNDKLLRLYAREVCNYMELVRHGETIIEHSTGHPGYTLVQLLETSSLTAHFAEEMRSAYIDLFSFSNFNVDEFIRFTKEFFRATHTRHKLLYR